MQIPKCGRSLLQHGRFYEGLLLSLKACFFHFYLSLSFNFHVDLSNEELFEYGENLDCGRDDYDFQDDPRLVKLP